MKDQISLLKKDINNEKTIVILDACRYDVFRKVNTIPGNLIKARSPSTETKDWIRKVSPLLENYHIISAHPWWYKLSKESGIKQHHVWKDDSNVNDLNVVEPHTILDKADELSNLNKLIHMVQPHLPYIRGEGKEFVQKNRQGDFFSGAHFTTRINNGKILCEWEDLFDYYEENVKVALRNVSKRREELTPLVVTADHGELIGEMNRYGHGWDHEKTREVPYLRVGEE